MNAFFTTLLPTGAIGADILKQLLPVLSDLYQTVSRFLSSSADREEFFRHILPMEEIKQNTLNRLHPLLVKCNDELKEVHNKSEQQVATLMENYRTLERSSEESSEFTTRSSGQIRHRLNHYLSEAGQQDWVHRLEPNLDPNSEPIPIELQLTSYLEQQQAESAANMIELNERLNDLNRQVSSLREQLDAARKSHDDAHDILLAHSDKYARKIQLAQQLAEANKQADSIRAQANRRANSVLMRARMQVHNAFNAHLPLAHYDDQILEKRKREQEQRDAKDAEYQAQKKAREDDEQKKRIDYERKQARLLVSSSSNQAVLVQHYDSSGSTSSFNVTQNGNYTLSYATDRDQFTASSRPQRSVGLPTNPVPIDIRAVRAPIISGKSNFSPEYGNSNDLDTIICGTNMHSHELISGASSNPENTSMISRINFTYTNVVKVKTDSYRMIMLTEFLRICCFSAFRLFTQLDKIMSFLQKVLREIYPESDLSKSWRLEPMPPKGQPNKATCFAIVGDSLTEIIYYDEVPVISPTAVKEHHRMIYTTSHEARMAFADKFDRLIWFFKDVHTFYRDAHQFATRDPDLTHDRSSEERVPVSALCKFLRDRLRRITDIFGKLYGTPENGSVKLLSFRPDVFGVLQQDNQEHLFYVKRTRINGKEQFVLPRAYAECTHFPRWTTQYPLVAILWAIRQRAPYPYELCDVDITASTAADEADLEAAITGITDAYTKANLAVPQNDLICIQEAQNSMRK